MTSNARAQRLIDEFEEGAAFAGGHSVRHGLAAVLRHLADAEAQYADMESFYAVPVHTLDGLANSLEAPTLLERAMAGDAAAARQFLHEGGFTDANGNLLPHLRSAEVGELVAEQLPDLRRRLESVVKSSRSYDGYSTMTPVELADRIIDAVVAWLPAYALPLPAEEESDG